MKSEISLREFRCADNDEYSAWFADWKINKYLGPAWTEQELTQILNDEPGSILSAYRSGELIGVISLVLPDTENTCIAITGIAVNPKIQRRGIGEGIFKALPAYYNTSSGQEWIAFINHGNSSAQLFLRKLGWQQGALENSMYRYTFKQL